MTGATAFVVGFAVCAGPALAWHMRDVARRYDAPEHPSGSETSAVAAAGARLGSDGPTRCLRFAPVTSATAGQRATHNPVLCLKHLPCTGPHVDDLREDHRP